ncbi:helix-turn-helix domain-containing protein [Methylophilus sp.]|uniref:helix-turn-helix domain-containing protein n=1 Tax=Methylophilus sp. TaxID=29541 RepID=UPI0040373C73
MHIKPIHNEQDYQQALHAVAAYFDNEPELNTPEGDRFEVLLTLIAAYETRHYQIDPPDPIEAIKFRMEQEGLTAKDLVPMIGQVNRVYEVLNRKRGLTTKMMWRLHQDLGISAESLIRPSAG